MFCNQQNTISNEEIKSILTENPIENSEYQEIIEKLHSAEILTPKGLSHQFKYRYAYHYFVAKYLSDNLNSPQIKEKTKDLCTRLNDDESANIVLFLTHHTQDTFITDELAIETESTISHLDTLSTLNNSPEIEELLEELSRLGTKDRKLKETNTAYSSPKKGESKKRRESLIYANNLIRILRDVFHT